MADKIADIVEKIKELTLVEASELKTALEDEFGVTAAAPVVMGGVPAAGGGELPDSAADCFRTAGWGSRDPIGRPTPRSRP